MRTSTVLVCLLLALSAAIAREDPRAGVVSDRQGTALVRPVGRERWTPLAPQSVLMPGDLVRTPVRGANAVELRLAGSGRIVLGPGGLLELVDGGTVRLLRGDAELTQVARRDGDAVTAVGDAAVFRARDGATERLDEAPRWLTGYRASTTDEWMGSLVANVDGRDVPLAVGYHKVSVDVRDQIARTTVEMSFLNATKQTLEGTFHFPLPADASISGFGMWIGDELVEADIVEKQRARAIYEDILRRREDPGLLEWSGGNLFKARVFPIFPHSEKRVRVQYTQVLPLEGGKLRYRYALRSELLRARPLRELRLRVNVSSTQPIRGVASPTHAIRARHTEHAASAEFDADDYAPEKDFELVVDVDRGQPLVVVPHRRGDDGYFMLLLSPPGAGDGPWQRELLPDTGALDLLVIADTSGSMDEAARDAQARFVGGLLELLGARDTFRLMTCDVGVHWMADEPTPAGEPRAEAALRFLAARPSLGWTDLDKAFAAAMERASAGTVVVYVGDGIGTTGDADPVALADRLRQLGTGICHAVSVSSSYERGVLEAIASIGGGSVRGTGSDPAAAAYALLAEAAQPAVKDLRVGFEGLRTARVYPERLPNLPAGAQQVVLGRYLPTGATQSGRVVVTGTLGGKPIRWSAELRLTEGHEGNSFVPRLWARRHLDFLLAQGRSPEVQAEIVGFSEEFGIMTPYTSFLVLESDAQRERYGVTRRVRMSDGERFFAEGKDQATTALLKQQMDIARTWRLRLREAALREIATLGRHLHESARRLDGGLTLGIGGGWGFAGGEEFNSRGRETTLFGGQAEEAGGDGAYEVRRSEAKDESEIAEPIETEELADHNEVDGDEDFETPAEPADDGFDDSYAGEAPVNLPASGPATAGFLAGKRARRQPRGREALLRSSAYAPPAAPAWQPFPLLLPPTDPPPPADTAAWPDGVADLLRSLDRTHDIAALPGGVEVRESGGGVHPLHGWPVTLGRARGLFGSAGWFSRFVGDLGQEPRENWLAGGERGVLAAARRLGRTRPAAAGDASSWVFPWHDQSAVDFARWYATWTVTVREREGDVVTLEFRTAENSGRFVLRVDAKRNVLLEWTNLDTEGKPAFSTRCSDFVEAGGRWWATRVESRDDEGRTTARWTIGVRELDAPSFRAALDTAVAGHGDAILLGTTDPGIGDAKQAVHERRATFADHFVLAGHFATTQQWDRVFEHWAAAAALVPGKPGASYLEAELLAMGRRGLEAKAKVADLAATPAPADPDAADYLPHLAHEIAARVFQADEMVTLIESLEPRFTRAGEHAAERRLRYDRMHASALAAARHPERALPIYAAIHAARPLDIRAVTDYTAALQLAYRHEQAIAVLRDALRAGAWMPAEAARIYDRLTALYWNERDLDAFLAAALEWIAAAPDGYAPFERYLAALLFLGREGEADAWVARRIAADPSPETAGALRAAVRFALGRGWSYWTNRIEERWHAPLADLAYRLMQLDDDVGSLSSEIRGDGRFSRTDAAAALTTKLRADIGAEGAVAAMGIGRLGRYLGGLPWGRNAVDADTWRRVADAVRARWSAAPQDHEREVFAGLLLNLLDQHGETDEAIAFLRERVAAAATPDLAWNLMGRLVHRPWTEAIENELLSLVPRLQAEGPQVSDEQRRAATGYAVRWLTGQLERMRYEALLGPAKEYEALPRTELKERRRTARLEARAGLKERFVAAAASAGEWSRDWYQLEMLCLSALARVAPRNVDGMARELFAGAEDDVLRERCAYVVAFLATRRDAPEGLADAAVAFLRERPAQPEVDWRSHLFRLLLALDRPDALAARLRAWIEPASVERRWRVALGYLLAERGELAGATAQFEAVAAADELFASEWAHLADWYLALDQEAKREDALVARHRVAPEWELAQRIWAETNRVSGRGDQPPDDLDPDIVRVERALLGKATRPANHVWAVQRLYRAVKDFRLLAALPDGAVGHTPEGVYPFLERVGNIFGEVHEEATCDELIARLRAVREAAVRAVDRRALTLMEALVERRAADVLNQAGPHADRGLHALAEAAQGEWLPGERRRMASFLESLGKIPQDAFAREQLRQLEQLARDEAPGIDRLEILRSLAATHWRYGRPALAIDVLAAAFADYRGACGAFTQEMQRPFDNLLDWLRSQRHFRRAEALVRTELDAGPGAHAPWLEVQLFQVYIGAVEHRGDTSLGRGLDQYRRVRERIEASLWQGDAGQLSGRMGQFVALHRAGRKGGIASAGTDLEAFAHERLPELVTRSLNDTHGLVAHVAAGVHDLVGARAGLAVLIERMEHGPAWLERVGRDGWNHHAYSLARWRAEAGALGDLEPRLLTLVLAELERDILSGGTRTSSLTYRGSHWFWRAKDDAFRAVALRLVETRPDDAAVVSQAAHYLWHGLADKERAVEALAAAEERGVLREVGRFQLVQWLQELGRWQPSLPLCGKLRAARPERLDYVVHEMRALHKTGHDADARGRLGEAEANLKEKEQWQEGTIATLAAAAQWCSFFDRGVALYEELIPLHQRTHRNRGVGGGTLSAYYGSLARCYTGLGRHDEAVDAASAAVVAWGRTHGNRQNALQELHRVVAAIPDLDAYAGRYEERARKSGLDAPVLRKAIGQVYLARNAPAKALPHLLAARDLQPNDTAIHESLLATYDALDRPRDACAALLGTIRVAPMELSLYVELGTRLAKLGDAEAAERAWTTLVEARPNESESHALLAKHREDEGRFGEAVEQWRQVVRVRTEEPPGWLSLARAQVRADDRPGARATLERLLDAPWVARFGEARSEARKLLATVE